MLQISPRRYPSRTAAISNIILFSDVRGSLGDNIEERLAIREEDERDFPLKNVRELCRETVAHIERVTKCDNFGRHNGTANSPRLVRLEIYRRGISFSFCDKHNVRPHFPMLGSEVLIVRKPYDSNSVQVELRELEGDRAIDDILHHPINLPHDVSVVFL